MRKWIVILAILLATLAISQAAKGSRAYRVSPSGFDIPRATLDKSKIDYPAIIQHGIDKVHARYGRAIAESVEKIYRLETAHFKSDGWYRTLAPGMHPFSNSAPYGWSSVAQFWATHPQYAPIGVTTLTEGGTGKSRDYLVFNGIGGFMTLGHVMAKRNNNPGSWYSTDASAQATYNQTLSGINTHYV